MLIVIAHEQGNADRDKHEFNSRQFTDGLKPIKLIVIAHERETQTERNMISTHGSSQIAW